MKKIIIVIFIIAIVIVCILVISNIYIGKVDNGLTPEEAYANAKQDFEEFDKELEETFGEES